MAVLISIRKNIGTYNSRTDSAANAEIVLEWDEI